MANSPAFQRIERDTLALSSSIPRGKICTYELLGAAIDVPARHVAYIVSRLDDTQREKHHTHRLVGKAGKLPAKPINVNTLLEAEGLQISAGAVLNWETVLYTPRASNKAPAEDISKGIVKVERTTRPAEHRRGSAGEPALSELRGLGPVSVGWLTQAGIRSTRQLRQADLYALYARIKSQQSKVSINLLYALMGAVEDQDWRKIAKERRSEVLMRLDDMKLL
jgi:DNA transformation protein and related proteins